jgi:hypothetical protein
LRQNEGKPAFAAQRQDTTTARALPAMAVAGMMQLAADSG